MKYFQEDLFHITYVEPKHQSNKHNQVNENSKNKHMGINKLSYFTFPGSVDQIASSPTFSYLSEELFSTEILNEFSRDRHKQVFS